MPLLPPLVLWAAQLRCISSSACAGIGKSGDRGLSRFSSWTRSSCQPTSTDRRHCSCLWPLSSGVL